MSIDSAEIKNKLILALKSSSGVILHYAIDSEELLQVGLKGFIDKYNGETVLSIPPGSVIDKENLMEVFKDRYLSMHGYFGMYKNDESKFGMQYQLEYNFRRSSYGIKSMRNITHIIPLCEATGSESLVYVLLEGTTYANRKNLIYGVMPKVQLGYYGKAVVGYKCILTGESFTGDAVATEFIDRNSLWITPRNPAGDTDASTMMSVLRMDRAGNLITATRHGFANNIFIDRRNIGYAGLQLEEQGNIYLFDHQYCQDYELQVFGDRLRLVVRSVADYIKAPDGFDYILTAKAIANATKLERLTLAETLAMHKKRLHILVVDKPFFTTDEITEFTSDRVAIITPSIKDEMLKLNYSIEYDRADSWRIDINEFNRAKDAKATIYLRTIDSIKCALTECSRIING